MGFFDSLFKKEARKLVSNMVDKAVDNVSDKITGKDRGTKLVGMAGLKARLEQVVANDYPTYELRKNVPASEMFAESGAIDYSYGIYKDGVAVALINVIDNRNEYSRKCNRLAKEAAQFRGVPHMNFFSHLPNETSYISERLRKEIR